MKIMNKNLIGDAMFYTSKHSGASPEVASGVVIGTVTTLQAVLGVTTQEAMRYLQDFLPSDYVQDAIPDCWQEFIDEERALKCEGKIDAELEYTLEDLRTITKNGVDDRALSELYSYGLGLDFVAPNTFDNQREGYFRWQLTIGGPDDEFRIFAQRINDYDWPVYRVEYWFLDWDDGARRVLGGEDEKLLIELFDTMFVSAYEAERQYNNAVEDY